MRESWFQRFRALVPSIFDKVVIANTLIIAIGAVAGTWIARQTTGSPVPLTIIFVLAGVAASIVVNYLVMRLAFAPIFELLRVMRDVEGGDWSARAPEVPDLEAQQLGRMLNQMLDRLDERHASIATFVIRAQEEERKRIARELHDETSQALTSILISLDMLENDPNSRRIDDIRKLAGQTLEEVKRLTYDLRPTILDDLGLVPAIRWYVRHALQPAGISVQFDTGEVPPLSPDVTTALYRIAQEAMTNILRYAEADEVDIYLGREGSDIVLRIRDDGKGFEQGAVPVPENFHQRGLGLYGMRERASLLGGRTLIESAPGMGTTVEARIPIEETGAVKPAGTEEDAR